MPLYTTELEMLKKELTDVRAVSILSGFIPKEFNSIHYKKIRYAVDDNVKSYIKYMLLEQEKDLLIYSKEPEMVDLDTSAVKNHKDLEDSEDSISLDKDSIEDVKQDEDSISESNYFNAEDLELLFSRVDFVSHHNTPQSSDLQDYDNNIIMALDRIFNYEIERLKVVNKSLFNNVGLMQRINKAHSKVKIGRIQEATSLISRFYNENKQNIFLGYLYMELLFAKAALGSQKALSQARDVANTVCFLTDKSDENLTSYYRYIYACREFVHDKEKALALIREFVLFDSDRLSSEESLLQRDGFYLKCLILFLRFDPRSWTVFEIENMYKLSNNVISGGIFYIYFIRDKIVSMIDTVRFKKFLTLEINLFNLYLAHSEVTNFIQTNYNKNGLPKLADENMHTVSQKYVQNFLKSVKVPSFSEFLANTSVSGIHYLEHTENDRTLSSLGILTNSLWRTWIGKISYEPSVQRPGLLPVELVAQEAKILSKYKSLAENAYKYEREVYENIDYDDVREMLADVRSDSIIALILGDHQYKPYAYGLCLENIKDYYQNLKMITKFSNNLVSGLILDKGKKGLFWNLEEIQLMLEGMNLAIDNKQIGIKARLDKLLDSKNNNDEEYQYMSFAEHLSMYWWGYILLISLLIVLFNLLFR